MVSRIAIVLLVLWTSSAAVSAQVRGESGRSGDAPGSRGVATRGESGRTPMSTPGGAGAAGGLTIDCPPADTPGGSPLGGSSPAGGATTWRGAWTRTVARSAPESARARVESGAASALSGRGRRDTALDAALLADEVVPALQRVVRRGSPSRVVAPAVLALGMAGRSELAPFVRRDVLAAARHESTLVRMHAAYALGWLGDVDSLRALLHDTPAGRGLVGRDAVDDDVRAAAAIGMALAGGGAADLALVAVDAEAPVGSRAAAIVALGARDGTASLAAELRRLALDGEAPSVLRVTSIATLGRWGDRALVPDAIAWMHDEAEPRFVRVAAARAIGDAAAAVPSVREALFATAERAGSLEVRAAAWSALGDLVERAPLDTARDVDAWVEAFDASFAGRAPASDRPWIARARARVAATSRAPARPVGLTASRVHEPDARLATIVAETLQGEGDHVDALLVAFGASTMPVDQRVWAAHALGATDSGRARDALFAMLRRETLDAALRDALVDVTARLDAERARAAVRFLRRTDRGPGVDDLLARLGDPDAALRAVVTLDDDGASVAARSAAAARLVTLVDPPETSWRSDLLTRVPDGLIVAGLAPLAGAP